MSTEEHKKSAPNSINAAILTISGSRTLENDQSGTLIKNSLEKNNHKIVERLIIDDDIKIIGKKISQLIKNKKIDSIITTGGTGLAKKDVTIEAVRPFFEKELISFNALFSKLSCEEIGSAAVLSRATAGIAGKKVIFCLPGSPKACKLAMEKLILPEIGHIIKHINEI
ncbi:MAG: molybdenum cofactor biosynthesis protein B [bacterium]